MKRFILLLFAINIGCVPVQAQSAVDSMRIFYRQGHRTVDPQYGDNRSELERFLASVRRACRNGEVDRLVIRAYASPDGQNRLNERLSQLRADSMAGYVLRHTPVSPAKIEKHAEGIAWDLLRELAAASDGLPCKEAVLDILDHTPLWIRDAGGRIVDGRKKRLMDLGGGVPYAYMLEHLFPMLRNSAAVRLYIEKRPETISRSAAAATERSAVADTAGSDSGSAPAPPALIAPEETAGTAAEPAAVTQRAVAAEAAPSAVRKGDPLHRLALKTNLLYDAVLMPSLEVEYHVADRWSVGLEGDVAWWRSTPRHKYYQIATISPEVRYWFKTRRRWHGHYAGIFAGGSWYDLENGGPGYRGELWTAGLSYGYMFPVSRSLSFEAGIGVGFLRTKYEEYTPYDGHNVYRQTSRTDYVGPVKLKFAFVWRLWDETDRKGGAR